MARLVHEGIENLVPYPPGKPIEELERELGIQDSIKLASNENPLGPSPRALEAISRKLASLHRYPDGSGYYLKNKMAEKFGVSTDGIILGNGSNEIIELVIRTFLSPGEEAIQPFPTFLVYEKIVAGAGGIMKSVPLRDFRVDLEGLLSLVTPRTKVIFVNNPNNPTGQTVTADAMKGFLDRVPDHVVVVLDEAYIEFVQEETAARGTDFLAQFPHLVVLRTFSKLYGLAGLRIGYGFSSPELVSYMDRVRQPFNANALAQAGALAALEDDEFVARTLSIVKEGLHTLYRGLAQMGLEFIRTQTNFFLIKVPGGGRNVYEAMLREGVIVRSMDSYSLPEYIRVNVGLPEENERFLKTLARVLGRG